MTTPRRRLARGEELDANKVAILFEEGRKVLAMGSTAVANASCSRAQVSVHRADSRPTAG